MKKFLICILVLTLAFALTACGKTEPEQLAVYSFSGENEQFAVFNGVIVLSSSNEIFCGGDLKINEEYISDIVSYSTTFYTMSGDEKRIILSNGVTDMTGGLVNVHGDLGQVSGDGILTGTQPNRVDDLQDNLYFELLTTGTDGKENTYQLQVFVTEVTKEVTAGTEEADK